MNWTLAIVSLIAAIIFVSALAYAFLPAEISVTRRLSQLLNVASAAPEVGFKDKQKEQLKNTLASVGKLISPAAPTSKAQLMLVRAGFRDPAVMQIINGVRLLLPVVFVAITFFSGVYRYSPIFILALAALIGYMLPEIWLVWRIRARQHKLRLGVPDGLDLLVICVEAGLGLDHALLRVSQDLSITHRELSDELQLVSAEMRLGKTRTDALRELARRTGLDEIKALVAMLVQTERFGTSIAQSLRVHSDDLRVKRRQRAEEMAAKIAVKMVPVLVFFIFPALMIVVLGPAVLTIMRQLLKM